MTKILPPRIRKVGAPQAIFSCVSGNARHSLRTRFKAAVGAAWVTLYALVAFDAAAMAIVPRMQAEWRTRSSPIEWALSPRPCVRSIERPCFVRLDRYHGN